VFCVYWIVVCYWNVSFSFGPGWGLNGYILIARNRGNTCGVASDATFATGWVQVAPTEGQNKTSLSGGNQRTTVPELTCWLFFIYLLL